MRIKISKVLLCSIPLIIIGTGCTKPFEKELERVESHNKKQEELSTAIAEEEYENSGLKLDENAKTVSVEEALKYHDKELEKEISKKTVKEKKSFKNEKEFSQFLSEIFYKYHAGRISSDEFYDTLSPHFHDDFNKLLPKSMKAQRETFKELQKTFVSYLSAEIIDYRLTELKVNQRAKEATFYRVYELSNGENIYYQSTIKRNDENWLLLDDSPARPYEVLEN